MAIIFHPSAVTFAHLYLIQICRYAEWCHNPEGKSRKTLGNHSELNDRRICLSATKIRKSGRIPFSVAPRWTIITAVLRISMKLESEARLSVADKNSSDGDGPQKFQMNLTETFTEWREHHERRDRLEWVFLYYLSALTSIRPLWNWLTVAKVEMSTRTGITAWTPERKLVKSATTAPPMKSLLRTARIQLGDEGLFCFDFFIMDIIIRSEWNENAEWKKKAFKSQWMIW